MNHSPKPIPLRTMAVIAVFSAITCILAPMALALPFTPVPISLTNFVIYLSVYLLGWKFGTVSYVIYLFLGLVGLPVFSGFSGGLAHLVGPRGGYLVGFIPMALISGWVIQRSHRRVVQILGMMVGTAICYLLGTIWFCFVTQHHWMTALGLCVFPFIPGDLVKILLAAFIGPVLQERVQRAICP